MRKVTGEEHEAVVLTKHVPRAILDKMSDSLGYWYADEERLKALVCDKLRNNYWDSTRQKQGSLTDVGDHDEQEHEEDAMRV